MTSPGHAVASDVTLVSLIIEHASAHDLPALCRASKSLNAPAERALYKALTFYEPHTAGQVCRVLAHAPRLAQLVRAFSIVARYSRVRLPAGDLPNTWWQNVAHALRGMSALESLVLANLAGPTPYGWVLPAAPVFQLREARILFPWTADADAFVMHQRALRFLHVVDIAPGLDVPGVQEQAALADAPDVLLPALEIIDVPVRIATQFLGSPLTHIQVIPDAESLSSSGDVMAFMSHLWRVRETLRSLAVHDAPEYRSAEIVLQVAQHCPGLQYLGVLALPPASRSTLHTHLMGLPKLVILELEVSRWSPAPSLPMQRALATELQTYCSSLRIMIFWLHSHRFVFHLNQDTGVWVGRADPGPGGPSWRYL
ncbi:hypothetical protein FA95DRAFT_1534686 [Auriscalpium vulgare]|uniref:Uncharacterized protein n=1 Tax=Auriscalpium vulgare TaxID=40419 RepID=A0ACB8S5W3_9AGAM|nr:hypothetical protein FA95DRAFT_1534686 [Auriscalpium vulgare]